MKYYPFKLDEQQKQEVFDKNFSEMSAFVSQHKRFPEKAESPRLYNWRLSMKTEYRKGLLLPENTEKLNAIGFIWNKNTFHWHERAAELRALLEQKEIPSSRKHTSSYHWLQTQRELLIMDQLSAEKRAIIEEFELMMEQPELVKRPSQKLLKIIVERETVVKQHAWEQRWEQKFAELTAYRKQHPNSWPPDGSKNENEVKLGAWCRILRYRYEKQNLSETWRDKLLSIGFNFDTVNISWSFWFQELSTYLAAHNQLPPVATALYVWTMRQYHAFDKLNTAKQQSLQSLNFSYYFEKRAWYKKYDKFKAFVLLHKKAPTKQSNKSLYNWLLLQRARFRSGHVTEEQNTFIQQLGIDLLLLRMSRWEVKYNALKQFINENNGRWPVASATDPNERKLGIWCQQLRSRYRKQLLDDSWRDKMLLLGFNFEGRTGDWKERFAILVNYIAANHGLPGTLSNLYSWTRTQFKSFNKLDAEKQALLNSINFLQYFTKSDWEKKYERLTGFMLVNKKAPAKDSDKELFHWLFSQRAKYRKDLLTSAQIHALHHLGIDLTPGNTKKSIGTGSTMG